MKVMKHQFLKNFIIIHIDETDDSSVKNPGKQSKPAGTGTALVQELQEFQEFQEFLEFLSAIVRRRWSVCLHRRHIIINSKINTIKY
jgi:hypothetical protein